MRALLLELATQTGIATGVRDIAMGELDAADEVFLCNSLIGIWPVTRVAERRYPTGKITRELQARLQEHMDTER
jgi:4-amino-4-deoxychorismate lyase